MRCCSEETYTFASVEMESSYALFGSFILLLIVLFIIRVFWVINSKAVEACDKREDAVKTMAVIGSG